jgi:hypothetical protein
MEKNRNKTLAEGEVTGHAHTATAQDAEVLGSGVDRALDAPSGTSVTHQEHETITLPPGQYDITRQREIAPDTEEARRVAD